MEAHIDKVKQQFSKQSQTFDSYQNEDAKNTFTENVVKAMQLRLPIFNDLTMWLNVLRKIPAHSYPVVDTCNIEKKSADYHRICFSASRSKSTSPILLETSHRPNARD